MTLEISDNQYGGLS